MRCRRSEGGLGKEKTGKSKSVMDEEGGRGPRRSEREL